MALQLVTSLPNVTTERTTSGWAVTILPPQPGLPFYAVFATEDEANTWAADASAQIGASAVLDGPEAA